MRRLPVYIHQIEEWPRFEWDRAALAAPLARIRHRQGRLLGRMEGLGFGLQRDAELRTLTTDVVMSSEIEGEHLDLVQVRSSVARRLGLEVPGIEPVDRDVDGVVEMMLDATQRFDLPLTEERLFGWQAALFPTGRSGLHAIRVGAWRDDARGPMQVVSGPIGRECVHFEAPPAAVVSGEMARFLAWANGDDGTDPVLKAAIAHLWFVTVHPFDDGNGRIGRAITDWQLARSEQSAQRFYSLSGQMRAERDAYYASLEGAQAGSLDITRWLLWFLECLGRAFDQTEAQLADVARKARFWERVPPSSINARQRVMLNRLLDGFEGKLTTQKWAALAKCSHDTALRDIQGLIEHGLLRKDTAGGRSTSYIISE